MKNKKNFYIVRFYLNGKINSALSILRKDAIQFARFYENSQENEAGGTTYWFRIDIDPNFRNFLPK
jgi:hypothetical protein